MAKAYMNWSGGKDASLALHRVLQSREYPVGCLLTNINAHHDRVSMHGVRRELIEAQARSIGIPLQTVELPEQPSMAEYETEVENKLLQLKAEGYTDSVFGDIYLEDLRAYREHQLTTLGLQARFPIWQKDSRALVDAFIALGFKAVVVCVNAQQLDREFCGRTIDEGFLRDLPPDVDPCGENGEFHSFVYAGPLFNRPVAFEKGEIVYREYKAPAVAQTLANEEGDCPVEHFAAKHDKPIPVQYGFYFCDLLIP